MQRRRSDKGNGQGQRARARTELGATKQATQGNDEASAGKRGTVRRRAHQRKVANQSGAGREGAEDERQVGDCDRIEGG